MSEVKMLMELSGWDEEDRHCIWILRIDQIQGYQTHEYWIILFLVGGLRVLIEYKSADEYREQLKRLGKVVEDFCYLERILPL